MPRRTIFTCASVLAGFLLFASSPAAGQASDDELARSHFQAGSAYFDQARYEDAAHEFLEAYRLSPRPELLLNASSAEERALHFDSATELLERYLAEVPDAANRRTLETRIERLRELQRRAQQPASAEAAPSEVEAHPPPPDGPAGAPVEPVAPSSSAGDVDAFLVSGTIAIGLGVVGLGIGGAFAAARETSATEWNGDTCWDPVTQSRATLCADARSAVDADEVGSIASFVVGGALLAAGAALVIVGSAGSEDTSAARLSCTPGLGSIACGGRF